GCATGHSKVCHSSVLTLVSALRHPTIGEALSISILGITLYFTQSTVAGDRHQLVSRVAVLSKPSHAALLRPCIRQRAGRPASVAQFAKSLPSPYLDRGLP